MLRGIEICLPVMLFFGGLCSFLYPTINGARLEKQASQATESFIEAFVIPIEQPRPESPVVSEVPAKYPELFSAMDEYNRRLADEQKELLSRPEAYEAAALNMADYGVEGSVAAVLSIPTLSIEMPVYLGASHENMASGAAVLGGTSLPIGGTDTNSVIAGHRGWNGASYFLNIDQLRAGDAVSVTNLWETLDYTVSEVRVIEPDNVDEIYIQPGRDLLTLMTCHPPATGGRYRLLVICERTTT